MRELKGEMVKSVYDLAAGVPVQIPADQVGYWLGAEAEAVGVTDGRGRIYPYAEGALDMNRSYWMNDWASRGPVRKLTGTMATKVDEAFHEAYRKSGALMTVKIKPTLGFDPEFFFEDDNGKVIPAWDILPGKDSKLEINVKEGLPEAERYPETALLYWDGFQGEFSFKSKDGSNNYSCAEQQMSRLSRTIMRLDALLKEKTKKKGRISRKSTIRVPLAELANLDPKKVEFGCEPSLNAYGAEPIMVDGAITELRPAGGHMHFGHVTLSRIKQDDLNAVVKMVDAIGGVASVAIFDGLDDPERRRLYGRAGEYRKTPYGFEYRVLSNQWLMHPTLAYLMIDIVRWGIDIALAKQTRHYYTTDLEVQEVINHGDAKLARAVVKRNEGIFRSFGKKSWGEVPMQKALHVIYHGIGQKFNGDVAKNWKSGSGQTWRLESLKL